MSSSCLFLLCVLCCCHKAAKYSSVGKAATNTSTKRAHHKYTYRDDKNKSTQGSDVAPLEGRNKGTTAYSIARNMVSTQYTFGLATQV